MSSPAIKQELINWLNGLTHRPTLEYLRSIMKAQASGQDWWEELGEAHQAGIERGLRDIAAGRVTKHIEVKKRYGL